MSADVEWTNNEASRSKAAIASLNYVSDPFVGLFCRESPLKRTPEINRGYYGRCRAVNHVIDQFCQRETSRAQIVNIGCGFDALYWRLCRESREFCRVVDVDTNQVIAEKVHTIDKCPELSRLLDDKSDRKGVCLHSSRYHAFGSDATKGRQLIHRLTTDCSVKTTDPILFVFECVLLYWTRDQTQTLVRTLATGFPSATFVVFDVIGKGDAFCHVMRESLSLRETPLLGSETTLEDWKQTFLSNSCLHVKAWDMRTVYQQLLDSKDRQRAESLEFLDETELLEQLLQHYCLVVASNYWAVQW
ncbi:leucine carboxyl methyltransferase 1-like [Oppia nitens]|uniref:leucine carboxyl methyltransferase 1-like n=1 Tax=Oppia nitens TaxID=1686743 RepID=UPI0023D9AEB7|nr:leucine carboxyl methyltransferase 1-like [Oppia nitens]